MSSFIPTRAAGLSRLADFTPLMGRAYAQGRNTDHGPDRPQAVSMLSPWLRLRLISEQEVARAAWDNHGELAMPFIQEIVWRSYFKGYLQQRPGIWTAFQDGLRHAENRLATEGGLRRVHHDACLGQTGIDGFDAWAQELAATGWLHNHARMWFASIWIFTLRLPWELGAAFFLRHLLDADVASNTLSWRWVAGLHTKGKHYVARAENIARFTDGRFDPRGQLDEEPEPLSEAVEHKTVALPAPVAAPPGPCSLLLHDDDLGWDWMALSPAQLHAVALLEPADQTTGIGRFATAALDDAAARLGLEVRRVSEAELVDWVRGQPHPVVTPFAPVGRNADLLRGLGVVRLQRDWDRAIWPHCTRGFFPLKQRLGEILPPLLA